MRLYIILILALVLAATSACIAPKKRYPAQDNERSRVSHLMYWKPVYLVAPADISTRSGPLPGTGRAMRQELCALMTEYARGVYAPEIQARTPKAALTDALAKGARYAVFTEAREEQGHGGQASPDLAVRVKVFDLQYGGMDYPVLDRTIRADGRDRPTTPRREVAVAVLVRQFMDQAYGPG